MKVEYIIIISVLVLIAVVTAISAYKTAVAAVEAERNIVIEKQSRTLNSVNRELRALQSRLEPKPYSLPTPNMWISSETGYRTDPMGGSEFDRLHKGVDLADDIGEPVYAVLSGVVREHWLPPDEGRWRGHPVLGGMITIEHEDGFFIYGHLSKTYIHEGDWIERGQLIGEIGDSGICTGPHLHLEAVVDPFKYLEER